MKKVFLFLAVLPMMAFVSCSKNNESAGEFSKSIFEFCHFTKDVIVSDSESTTIAFLAIPFDDDKKTWEIKIFDKDGNKKETSIQTIKSTNGGYIATKARIMKVEVKTTQKLDKGNYTIQITNKNTGQTLIESFLVAEKILPINSISANTGRYLINLSCNREESSKFILVKDSKIYLEISDRFSEISGVYFQQKNGNTKFGLNVTNEGKNIISVNIPSDIPTDDYFMMIVFNSVMSDIEYYPNTIGIVDKILPIITAINKEEFKTDETIILTGENFRFKIDEKFIPNKYMQIETNLGIVFDYKWNDSNNSSVLYSWNNEYTINEEGTRIECSVGFVRQYILNKGYNDAEIYVRSYAGDSNKKKIIVTD